MPNVNVVHVMNAVTSGSNAPRIPENASAAPQANVPGSRRRPFDGTESEGGRWPNRWPAQGPCAPVYSTEPKTLPDALFDIASPEIAEGRRTSRRFKIAPAGSAPRVMPRKQQQRETPIHPALRTATGCRNA